MFQMHLSQSCEQNFNGLKIMKRIKIKIAFAVEMCDVKNKNFIAVKTLEHSLKEEHDLQIIYLSKQEEMCSWYQIGDVDILVSLEADYDVWRIKNPKNELLILAWIKDDLEWVETPYLDGYHYIMLEESDTSELIREKIERVICSFDGSAKKFMEIISCLKQHMNMCGNPTEGNCSYYPLIWEKGMNKVVNQIPIFQEVIAKKIVFEKAHTSNNLCRDYIVGWYLTMQAMNVYSIRALSKRNSVGIYNKIRLQCKSLSQLGEVTYADLWSRSKSALDGMLKKFHLYEYYFLSPDVDWKDVDYLYLRRPDFLDSKYINFIKHVRQQNSQIILLFEIPTYPYDKEYNSAEWRPKKIIDQTNRANLKEYIDAIVTYSNDEKIFGIPAIHISNAVDCKYYYEIRKNLVQDKRQGIHMIACAQFTYWHGYDRVIEGMRLYLQKLPNANIVLHMVGQGPEMPYYRQLVGQYHLESHVIFHGILVGEELVKLYMSCDIGFDSLGRHRSGVYYNSSLKGKEYAANGLLIVSGVITELDSDTNYPYYFRVPADDTPINMEKIFEFYDRVMKSERSRENMQRKIMKYATEHFDMNVAFRPVLDFIKQKFAERNKV